MPSPRALPAAFARTLRELYASRDPQFTPTVKAAHDKGWSYVLLGDALEITSQAARYHALKETEHVPVPHIPEPTPGASTESDDRPRLTPEQVAQLRALGKVVSSPTARLRLAEEHKARDRFHDALLENWLRGVRFEHLAEHLNFKLENIAQCIYRRAWTRSKDFTDHPVRAKFPRGRSIHDVGYATHRANLPPYIITACNQYGDVGEFLPGDIAVTCSKCRRANEK